MQIFQKSLKSNTELEISEIKFEPQLILLFAGKEYENLEDLIELLHKEYPNAIISGCSTSGEIMDVSVNDQTVSLTAVHFERSQVAKSSIDITDMSESYHAASLLAQTIENENLRHVFILSDGLNVNGAELVQGLIDHLPDHVTITGGLAGDGPDFQKTFVIDDSIVEKKIVAISFYGKDLKIGYGSKGGWDSFGIEREVTKSEGSVLYELDGQPALDVYKKFLGAKAQDLPGSGLLFPLSLRVDENLPVVRTILAIDEEAKSLTFAGSIPQNSYARLMKANIDRVINGASESASISKRIGNDEPELAILISCIGRKLVLKQLVEEEVEAVKETIGGQVEITGFYSYGEIAPFGEFTPCQLHNQTMTITTISE